MFQSAVLLINSYVFIIDVIKVSKINRRQMLFSAMWLKLARHAIELRRTGPKSQKYKHRGPTRYKTRPLNRTADDKSVGKENKQETATSAQAEYGAPAATRGRCDLTSGGGQGQISGGFASNDRVKML